MLIKKSNFIIGLFYRYNIPKVDKKIWHDIKYYMFDNIISNLFFDLIFVVLYP